jgi:hypothetical protein
MITNVYDIYASIVLILIGMAVAFVSLGAVGGMWMLISMGLILLTLLA